MAVSHARVTASTTPVALNAPSTAGMTLLLKNESANAADVGGSTVAAGAGMSLPASGTLTVRVNAGDQLFAIRSAAADAVISVIRT